MLTFNRKKFYSTLLAFFIYAPAHALILETPDLNSCLISATHATVQLEPEDVIYVFDIDNTVLALNQNLGSVQWFRWQQKLILDNVEKNRVADTVDELLNKQGLIYKISSAHTPEMTTTEQVLELQRAGHPVLYHTSRNTDVRDITERDLKKNNLLPLIKTIGPQNGYAGKFLYNADLKNQRAVSFQDGIYMTAGQDKGIWLQLLLEKTATKVKHIVFVDDEIKNLQNVERVFTGITPMTLCRYGKVDDVVNRFNNSNKSTEVELWQKLFNATSLFN
jgi:hypothetical protein